MRQTEQIQVGRLAIDIAAEADLATYVFKGEVDEKFDFRKIPVLGRPTVRFHLGGLRHFNSCGVREWVFFMREFAAVPRSIVEECSVVVVDQFNVVPQVLGKGVIRSLYAPYFCEACDEEVECLLDAEKYRKQLLDKHPPELRHNCGQTMQFDALEDTYFQHVGRSLISEADAALLRRLEGQKNSA